MTINQQIEAIIEDQYNGYRGKFYSKLSLLHKAMRSQVGDSMFLAFLEKQQRDNPRPIYKLPQQITL